MSVASGATLQIQGGIAVPCVPMSLGGAGTNGNGALENVSGGNSCAGSVALVGSNTRISVDGGSLTLAGAISGASGITVGGNGVLTLANTGSSFSGPVAVSSGTLSVPAVNNTYSSGPLGNGGGGVALAGAGSATLEYTGASAVSNRSFTLAAGGIGALQIDGAATNLGLVGTIGGNGALQKTGPGMLTLSASNGYSGSTMVSGGTLAIDLTGSINGTSGISIGQGATLQISSSGGSLIPSSVVVTMAGGSLVFIGNGSVNGGANAGPLVVNSCQNNVAASRTGGTFYMPALSFAGSPPAPATGATLTFSEGLPQIQFASPPALSNGILGGGVFYGTSDFAACTTSAPYTITALASYTSGNLGGTASNSTLNVRPSGTQSALSAAKTFNSLNLTGSEGVTMGSGGALTLVSGGILANTSGSISGGTLTGSQAGSLIVSTVTNLTIGSVIADNGGSTALVKTGTGTLLLTGHETFTGNTYIDQGTLAYAPTANLSYPYTISGPGNLAMSGSGASLTLGGTNTYTGLTTLTGGTLCVNGSLAGGGGVNLQGGALTGGGQIAGSVTATGGTTAEGGSGSIVGSVTVNSGRLTIGQVASGGWLTATGGISVGGSGSLASGSGAADLCGGVSYTSSASSTFGGSIVGQGSSITLDAPAGVVLSLGGSNQFGGGTFLYGGTLQTSHSAALAKGNLTITAGTLDMDGAPLAVASLTGGTGSVVTSSASGASMLTVSGGSGGMMWFAGEIADGSAGGAVGLTLANAAGGGLLLSGSNFCSGGTTVDEGTLCISRRAAIMDSTSLTIGAGGAFIYDPMATASLSAASAASVAAPSSQASAVAAVPEPGSFGLLLAASVVLGMFARRRGRAASVRGRQKFRDGDRPGPASQAQEGGHHV